MIINSIKLSDNNKTFGDAKKKVLYSREILKEYAKTDKSVTQIASELKASPNYLRIIFRAMGLSYKERFAEKFKNDSINYEDFKTQVDNGKSLRELARFFNVTVGRVRQCLLNFGLKTKSAKALEEMPIEKIKGLINEDYSQPEIEDILGFSRGTLTHYFKKHNLTTQANAIVETLSKEDFAEFLKPGVTIDTLSYSFRVSRATIVKMLEKYGLSIPKKELDLEEVKILISQGCTIEEIHDELQCSYPQLKEFMTEHNLAAEKMTVKTEYNKTKRVYNSGGGNQNSVLSKLNVLIDKKLSVDEIAKELNLTPSKVENLLIKYNRTPMHLENYECSKPINEQGRFKTLLKEGDSSVQLAEIYGVSANTAAVWLKKCNIKVPQDKASPTKEEVLQVLEKEKNTKAHKGKVYNFGKALNISNASFEYLVEKYGLEELYWRIKYNI